MRTQTKAFTVTVSRKMKSQPISRTKRKTIEQAIALQYGFSLRIIRRNRLAQLPMEARLVMIGDIRRRLESNQTRTVAKKRRGSLASLGMPTVYRRREP